MFERIRIFFFFPNEKSYEEKADDTLTRIIVFGCASSFFLSFFFLA